MSIYKEFCEEKFDDKGRLTDFSIKYEDNFNFAYDVVDYIAAVDPNKTALVWCNTKGEEHVFSFKDISDLSSKAANVFTDHGIKKGDMVMVVLKRNYEYWYVSMALHKIGAVIVPTTHMLTGQDMEYRITTAKIKAVICTSHDHVPEHVAQAAKGIDKLLLWTVGSDQKGFMNLSAQVENASAHFDRVDTRATDPLIMYFTSGTTGYPKGVIHDHTYPLAHIITAKYWQRVQDGGLHFTVAETGWGKTSWGKLYGQWLCGCAVMVYDFDNFDSKNLVTIINKYKVTTFCAPPTVYRYMVKKGGEPMPSLIHASTAGEALNPEVFRKFKEQTGLTLMEGFGQTESTLLLGNFYEDESRPGSMGKPSPMYHMDVYTGEGKPAPSGEIGELVVVPPKEGKQLGIFCGYYQNDAMYKHVWRQGVFHTGDTVWRDEDGFYWFNGRIDDVIKTGGYRVGPFEIENVLMEHPAVLECSVVGVPDPLRGQAIKAVVILTTGTTPSAELQKEIKEFANKRLAEYKWIRRLEFVTEMPKTISGKIRKTELRK